jgi:hypothetical protein
MRTTWVPISLLAALSMVAVAPKQALADTPAAEATSDKATCEQAFEQAQREQNQSHYLAAMKQTLLCANPKCGDAIFNECTRMYTAIEQATPSVVLVARDPAKAVDLTEVNVTIDGQSVADHLDGKPVSIDPGAHTLVFTAANYTPEERKLLIGAGDKYRQVSVTLTSTDAPLPSTAPPAVASPDTAPVLAPRKVPVASYVLGGVGVAAIGAGVVLRLVGASKFDSLQTSCSPTCSSSQVDPVKTKYLLSDVAFGVGAAAVVGAIVIYAAAPRQAEQPSTAFMLVPTPGGASAGLWSTF